MSDYDNTNRGALFKNDRKESDRHPDYRGNINVDGTEYWLSAWIKEGRSGKFMSLSVQPKEGQQRQERPAAPRSDDPGNLADLDDSVPF